MKHWLRICILLLAALLLLAVPVMGYEIPADFSGTTLDEVMDKTILAMRSCEASVSAEQAALCGV